MIEHILPTGTDGEMRILDYTDDPDLNTLELWVKSSSAVAIAQLPWAYSIGSERSSWRSYNFDDVILWQRLTIVYLAAPAEFTFHLGDSNTAELGGPTDLTIETHGYDPETGVPVDPYLTESVYVRVDGVYKRAQVYANVGGIWTPAVVPYIKTPSGWKRVS